MMKVLAENLVSLKKKFSKIYEGKSNIQEIIPVSSSKKFPLNEQKIELLHRFAAKNPIYYNSYEEKIDQVQCRVYEGDINSYWLSSISHESSKAPFSPTWILSAYIATLFVKQIGYAEIIDIGSGDGRIAFCGKIENMESYGIEIDEDLVDLQRTICQETNVNFNPTCEDATKLNYNKMKLKKPAFFIGGLAQMGGNVLASSIIENIKSNIEMKQNAGMVFVGTYSEKYAGSKNIAGWGNLIEKNNLELRDIISLPTVWTFKESKETPYLFTKFQKK